MGTLQALPKMVCADVTNNQHNDKKARFHQRLFYLRRFQRA